MFSLHFNSIEQTARKHVNQNMQGLSQTLTRLSTGKRVNSPKDDPAAFIGAELIRSENTGLQAQLKVNQRRGIKLGTMDSQLSAIGNLLTDLKGLILEGANSGAIGETELNSLQMQIDYTVDAIQRMVQSDVFKGEAILDELRGLLSGLGLFDDGATDDGSTTDTATTYGESCRHAADSSGVSATQQSVSSDSLSNLRQLFFSDENGTTGLNGIFTFLSNVARIVAPGTELGALSADLQAADEAVDSDSGLVADAVDSLEEGVASGSADLATPENANETAPDTPAEPDGSSEAASTVETAENTETGVEAEDGETSGDSRATEVAEDAPVASEDVEAASATESGAVDADEPIDEETDTPTGTGYVFRRHLDELNFWNEERTETKRPVVQYEVADSFASVQADLTGNLLNQAVAAATCSPPSLGGSDSASSLSSEKNSTLQYPPESAEDENEDADETSWIGGLSDLKKGGAASLKNDPEKADAIVERAISAVSLMRAAVGAERKYGVDVDTAMIQDKLRMNESALSELTDADYTVETSNLARYQILLQSSMMALRISQQIPKMILDMLDAGYRSAATGRSG